MVSFDLRSSYRPAPQESLTNATRDYMTAEELEQLRSAMEVRPINQSIYQFICLDLPIRPPSIHPPINPSTRQSIHLFPHRSID